MKFNVNNCVRVRLTDKGREILRQNHDALWKGRREYTPTVTEDEDGWSKWQLWALMQEFGPHMWLGGVVPFETEIEVLAPMKGPDWKTVYAGCVPPLDIERAREPVLVTRETARLAHSALQQQNEQDFYHNYGAAQQELKEVL
jgi:DNA-binding MarR family transcriptional regulator